MNDRHSIARNALSVAVTFVALAAMATTAAAQTPSRPNIVVIFGDDIGQTNISACSMG